MNLWGFKMHDAVHIVAEMAAVGLGLPADSFTKRAELGPHLLAPTGTDLDKYNKCGTTLAGM